MTAIRVTWTIVVVSVMTAMAALSAMAVTAIAVTARLVVNYYLVAQIKSQKEPGRLLYR